MINVSNTFKKELYDGHRNYLEYVDITLANGRVLNLTNADLWQGGLSIDDSVSSENSFEVGSAIINKCTVVINNIYEDFSPYDFTDARVVAYVGLELPDGTKERIRKGTYAVDDAKYNGSIITLSCLDNMRKFDKAYTASVLKYPATLGQIVRDACSMCDVVLQTQTFSHDDFVIPERPIEEATTFREIISWAAQIAGCFCRCDVYGRLELKWYDQQALEVANLDGGIFDQTASSAYQSGDNADGGTFNPWNTGYEFDGGTFDDLKSIIHITSRYSIDISVDDVVITGIKVVEKNKKENEEIITTYRSGTDGYVISIENNDFITDGAGQSISGWLGEQLIGFRFRRGSIAHPSNPTMEAGDVGFLTDRKGNTYRIVVSSTRFSTGSSQTTTSSAENPARNSADRFSAQTKNYVEYRKLIQKERTEREKDLDNLKQRMDESPGLFTTEETLPDGGRAFYMHNKPTLAESDIVWRMTAEAWGVSTDGGKTYNAGMTVDGDTITRILRATGINADWINAGEISANIVSSGMLDGITIRNKYYNEKRTPPVTECSLIDKARLYFTDGNRSVGQIGVGYTHAYSSDGTLLRDEARGLIIAPRIPQDPNELMDPLIPYPDQGVLPSESSGSYAVNKGTLQLGNYSILIEEDSDREDAWVQFHAQVVTFEKVTFRNGIDFIGNTSLGGDQTFRVREDAHLTVEGGMSARSIYISDSLRQTGGATLLEADVDIYGAFVVHGTKSRCAKTQNYGERLQYCYEMPSPMFGDIGEAETDDSGECYIYLDDVFSETVTAAIEYQVFLQKEGPGDIWVGEKTPVYFKVKGTENLKFAWEIKAKQKDYEYERLDTPSETDNIPINYEDRYEEEIRQLLKEREETLYETT